MKKRKNLKGTFYQTNWQIRAPKLRLIDQQNKQIGIVSLQEARKIAQKRGLDLVEIAPRANPPVAKIVNYAKFKYDQNKKRQEARKNVKKSEKLKEIQLSPFIGQADLETRVERAKKFAREGNRLKIVVKFRGRQITRKQFSYQLLENVKKELTEIYQQDGAVKLAGKRLIMLMNPKK